ncbi:MAG: LysR family transcriptional regulator [Acidobacteria bacterium]|nr:LysR family transcriptional regulator [Acidobacteriota bacterium]
MDTRTLLTFSTAARTLSFTKTAATLSYAQSSVTSQMKALEELLGYPLFNRVGNHLQLTEPGHRFLVYAERILALTEEAMAATEGESEVGTVRFTAPESICTYLLPPVLKAFNAEFPKVRMQFVPGYARDFKRMVLEGAIDCAIVLEEPFPSKTLAVEKLRDEEILILGAPTHRLAKAAGITAQDLVGEAVLLKALGCSYRNHFERQLFAAGAQAGSGLEFQTVETIKRCVEVGLGVAPLPRMAVAEDLRRGRLVALPWAGEPICISTFLVWNPQRHLGSAEVAFLACVRRMVPSSL